MIVAGRGEGVYAHSRNAAGARHLLLDHLAAVAELARAAALPFGGDELAWWAGWWHDLGKFHPEFQRYLIESEAGTRPRGGPDHKAAGTSVAKQHLEPLAALIAGHHGGLRNLQDELRPWLAERLGTLAAAQALAVAREAGLKLDPDGALAVPDYVDSPLAAELFLRMLFSALVDADFLDTEAHFASLPDPPRGATPAIGELRATLERAHASFAERDDSAVNRVRDVVYRACVAAAEQHPGFFRLNVPTGGGKTLSSLAFALRHAERHGLRRVIV